MAIDFDDDGVVRDVEPPRPWRMARLIAPNPNATPAPGREFSFLEQLIGNFGKLQRRGKKTGTARKRRQP